MKILKITLLALAILVSASLFAAEAPPAKPTTQYNLTTLTGLPTELKQYLFPFIASGNIEQGIVTAAAINKQFHNLVNNPATMLALLNWILANSRYTVNAIDLAERLQKKTITLPVMNDQKIVDWIDRAKKELSYEKSIALEGHIRYHQNEKINALLANKNIDLNIKGINGWTPLISAAIYNPAVVKDLIAAGANLDLQDNTGFSALHWAAFRNNAQVTQLLLYAGANLNLETEDGETARDKAQKRGYQAIVNLIDAEVAKRNIKPMDIK